MREHQAANSRHHPRPGIVEAELARIGRAREQFQRVVGLKGPVPTQGRGHYFASRGAATLAIAILTMACGYGLSTFGAFPHGSGIEVGVGMVAGLSYALSLHCLIRFWSVPRAERYSEGVLDSTSREQWLVQLGSAVSVIGLVALAGLVLRAHW